MPSRGHDELPAATTRARKRFTGPQQAVFAALPTAALELLAIHGRAEPDGWIEQEKVGLPRPVRRFVLGHVMLEVATDHHGQLRLARETWGRRWADEQGIPTVPLHGAANDGSWLISKWFPPLPTHGPAADWPDWDSYLNAAHRITISIAASDTPPAAPPAPLWRSPRSKRVARAARGVLAGVPPRLWWATRRAATVLPTVPVAHGDFYYRNLPWDTSSRCGYAVDWEYLGPGPRYGDALRFWSVLPHRPQRDDWLQRVLSTSPGDHHHDIALLALWYALRRVGENVKAPREHRSSADTAHAWSVLPEAQELARSYRVYPL